MNGNDRKLYQKFYQDVLKPIATIEEWVRIHDEHAQERFEETKEWRRIINKTLSELPCGQRTELTKQMSKRIDWLYFAFITVVISGIVLGIWVKFTFGGQ